jgi:hypothetical protein
MEIMKMLDNLYPESDIRDVTFAVVQNDLVADEKKECQSTVNELTFNFFANVPLYAWNNMLGSMQYQVRCMLSDFSILQIAISTSWTGQHG